MHQLFRHFSLDTYFWIISHNIVSHGHWCMYLLYLQDHNNCFRINNISNTCFTFSRHHLITMCLQNFSFQVLNFNGIVGNILIESCVSSLFSLCCDYDFIYCFLFVKSLTTYWILFVINLPSWEGRIALLTFVLLISRM